MYDNFKYYNNVTVVIQCIKYERLSTKMVSNYVCNFQQIVNHRVICQNEPNTNPSKILQRSSKEILLKSTSRIQ